MYYITCNALEVFRCDFWMCHHGAGCPKRTSTWSNDPDVIGRLVGGLVVFWKNYGMTLLVTSNEDRGPLKKEKDDGGHDIVTTCQELRSLYMHVVRKLDLYIYVTRTV